MVLLSIGVKVCGEDDDMGGGEEDCESGSEVYSEDGGG